MVLPVMQVPVPVNFPQPGNAGSRGDSPEFDEFESEHRPKGKGYSGGGRSYNSRGNSPGYGKGEWSTVKGEWPSEKGDWSRNTWGKGKGKGRWYGSGGNSCSLRLPREAQRAGMFPACFS